LTSHPRIHHGIFERFSKGIWQARGDDIDLAIGEINRQALRREERLSTSSLRPTVTRSCCRRASQDRVVEREFNAVRAGDCSRAAPERRGRARRTTLEKAIMPRCIKSGEASTRRSPPQHTPRDIDRCMLVGGTARSRHPPLRDRAARRKEPEPFDQVDPMTCVAQGAAIVSASCKMRPDLDRYVTASSSSIRSAPTRSTSAMRSTSTVVKRGSISVQITTDLLPGADPTERSRQVYRMSPAHPSQR